MDPALEIEMAALPRSKAINEALEQGDSDIQKFYANTTVFITGGTGFLGKHLIEKVCRSCKITKMYLLMRSKKGKSIKERLEEMLEDPLYSSLQTSQPEFSSRLVCVEGDVSEIRLGLSEQDWQMLADQVEVIFHCAATTRFDEKLRKATRINVRGTREALLLARAAGRLKLIKNWPNTYTFCKAVGEDTVRTMSEGLPVSIIRPGIILPSYSEPTPGWTDKSTVFGASGLMLGATMGVLHVMLYDRKMKNGAIPCDYITNAVIAAGRETSCKQRKGGNDTPIYNVTSVARNSVTWQMMSNDIKYYVHRIASSMAVYYYYGLETSSILLFKIMFMFVHIIPAYILDAICFVLRKDRMFVKLNKTGQKMIISLSYFCLNQWIFLDNNTDQLYKSLSKKDQLIFNFDVTTINWTEFIKIWIIGVRKYIIKDGLKSTDKGLRKQFWFRILHYFLSCVYFCLLYQVIVTVFNICRCLLSLFL